MKSFFFFGVVGIALSACATGSEVSANDSELSASGRRKICLPLTTNLCRCDTTDLSSRFVVRTCNEDGTAWTDDCDDTGSRCPPAVNNLRR